MIAANGVVDLDTVVTAQGNAGFQFPFPIDDTLPDLRRVVDFGTTYNLIVINAVWQHLCEIGKNTLFRALGIFRNPKQQ